MKKSLFLGIIVGLVVLMSVGFQAHAATDVGGVIDADTTWDLAGSPYIVTGNTLVDSGVRLTIEPSVQIRFNGNYVLTIQGNIRALGTQGNEILFTSNLTPQQKGDWDFIELTNNTGSELNGIIVEYSKSGIHITNGNDINISNNIFRHNQITALSLFRCYNSYVNNNYFYDSTYSINPTVRVSYGGTNTFINNTLENARKGIHIYDPSDVADLMINNVNFFQITEYAVEVSEDQGAIFDSRYNYWGPETTAEMDLKGPAANIDKIYDFYDNPLYGRVDYAEWLNAPNPDAYPWMGMSPVNQSPLANSGTDQVVFDEVTLDGGASYDPDGSLDTYYWNLKHTNPANNRTSDEVSPTISGLAPGFYNACLTVTDNLGATDMKCCLLAAAGACSTTTFPDSDEDGEPDLTDLCPDTPADTMVDSDGCSLLQFCSAIDANSNYGRKICRNSDWKNDEPLKNKGDCKPFKKGFSDFSCVPR